MINLTHFKLDTAKTYCAKICKKILKIIMIISSRITANTLAQLQKRVGPLPDHSSSMGRNKKQKQENMISANPGTNAIMNMIKNLQEEIEVFVTLLF